MTREIESIQSLPENTGFAVTFTTPFQSGILNSMGTIQGLMYKAQAPVLRFAVRCNLREDPYTLHFVCICSDQKLVQRELLPLMQELKLVHHDIEELPFAERAPRSSTERTPLRA